MRVTTTYTKKLTVPTKPQGFAWPAQSLVHPVNLQFAAGVALIETKAPHG